MLSGRSASFSCAGCILPKSRGFHSYRQQYTRLPLHNSSWPTGVQRRGRLKSAWQGAGLWHQVLMTKQEKSQTAREAKGHEIKGPWSLCYLASGLRMVPRIHKDLIIFVAGPWNVRLFFQNKMNLRPGRNSGPWAEARNQRQRMWINNLFLITGERAPSNTLSHLSLTITPVVEEWPSDLIKCKGRSGPQTFRLQGRWPHFCSVSAGWQIFTSLPLLVSESPESTLGFLEWRKAFIVWLWFLIEPVGLA